MTHGFLKTESGHSGLQSSNESQPDDEITDAMLVAAMISCAAGTNKSEAQEHEQTLCRFT